MGWGGRGRFCNLGRRNRLRGDSFRLRGDRFLLAGARAQVGGRWEKR